MESHLMKVLIALDATQQSLEIVSEAAVRPWPASSEFLLLHVLDPFPYAKMPISLERAKQAAKSQLESGAGLLRKAGWKAETEVVLGRARQLITKTAATWAADFVLVGSYGGGALLRVLMGSTARSVLRLAPCSVEIVRSPKRKRQQPGMRVLLTTDGSECSVAAIRSVANRPWPKGTSFKVISIPEPFMPLSEFPYFELKEVENLNTAALKDAKRYAAAGAEILAKAGLEVHVETPLPRNTDAREITNAAKRWRAQLVVLGSHGRRGFDRWTIGSVSEHVALHAHCSVEVIREIGLATNASGKDSKM
jgi:nucleotide-binding universal stress UspA family protein